MSKGVFTRMKRVTFVEKTGAEVGNGTDYPMLVTLDQLAEIMYRVKDAYFTGGKIVNDSGFYHDLTFTDVAPKLALVNYLNVSGDGFSGSYYHGDARGYYTTNPIPEQLEGYFGESYIPLATEVRDIALNERGLWVPEANETIKFSGEALLGPSGSSEGFPEVHTFGCAFSHHMFIDSGAVEPTEYAITYVPWISGNFYANLYLVFSGEVAWVDTTGSGNPYDSGNSLYLGVYFNLTSAYGSGISSVSSYGTLHPDIRLELKLSSSSTYCRLYGSHDKVGTNFVCEATKWWPYAKDSPAVPVWDADTGLKI